MQPMEKLSVAVFSSEVYNLQGMQAKNEGSELEEEKVNAAARLARLYMKQTRRNLHFYVLKYFRKWAVEFPLMVKCEEMTSQLRERNNALETVRSSYLRDVIAVKHHLDQVTRVFDKENKQSIGEVLDGIKQLHAVPSPDLRDAIEKAKKSPHLTSIQLRDNLIDAGILDPASCKTLNPWEQSRSFRRFMRTKRGPSFQFPDTGGESITLAAPADKKLYVRYCSACIGVLAFIRGWNTEIEDAFRYKADFQVVDAQMLEFKQLINRLQNIITDQEAEILKHNEKIRELEIANAWFEKWSFMQDHLNREEAMNDLRTSLLNSIAMANADKESTVMNVMHRTERKIKTYEEQEKTLKHTIKHHKHEVDSLVKQRLKLIDDLNATSIEMNNKKNHITSLDRLREQDSETIAQLQSRVDFVEARNEELLSALQTKEEEFKDFRDTTHMKIDSLSQKLALITEEYNAKENEVDELREDLRGKKIIIANHTKEIASLKSRVAQVEDEKQKVIDFYTKKRHTLRGVAMMVKAFVRLQRSTTRKGYLGAGAAGGRELIRKCRVDIVNLEYKVSELQDEVSTLEKKAEVLRGERDTANDHCRKSQLDLNRLQLKERNLRSTLHESQNKLRTFQLQLGMRIDEATFQKFTEEYKQSVIQSKLLLQLQRHISNHLSKSLFMVRTVIQSFDIETQLRLVKTRQFENIIPPIKPRSISMGDSSNYITSPINSFSKPAGIVKPIIPRSKIMAMLNIFKNRGKLLLNWMQNSRDSKRVGPQQVPISSEDILKKDDAEDAEDSETESDDSESDEEEEAAEGEELSAERKVEIAMKRIEREKKQKAKDAERAAKQAKKEAAKKLAGRAVANAEVMSMLKEECKLVEELRSSVLFDIKSVDDYIYHLRKSQMDLLQRVRELECKEHEERAARMKLQVQLQQQQQNAAMDTNASRGSSGNNKKVAHLKASFTHLLDKQDVTSYFSNIVSAIEQVQQEHGHLYNSANAGSNDRSSPHDAADLPMSGHKRRKGRRIRRSVYRPMSSQGNSFTHAAIAEEPEHAHLHHDYEGSGGGGLEQQRRDAAVEYPGGIPTFGSASFLSTGPSTGVGVRAGEGGNPMAWSSHPTSQQSMAMMRQPSFGSGSVPASARGLEPMSARSGATGQYPAGLGNDASVHGGSQRGVPSPNNSFSAVGGFKQPLAGGNAAVPAPAFGKLSRQSSAKNTPVKLSKQQSSVAAGAGGGMDSEQMQQFQALYQQQQSFMGGKAVQGEPEGRAFPPPTRGSGAVAAGSGITASPPRQRRDPFLSNAYSNFNSIAAPATSVNANNYSSGLPQETPKQGKLSDEEWQAITNAAALMGSDDPNSTMRFLREHGMEQPITEEFPRPVDFQQLMKAASGDMMDTEDLSDVDDDGDGDEEDEDDVYKKELEIARSEAVAFLAHDKALNDAITKLTEDNSKLHKEISHLKGMIDEVVDRNSELVLENENVTHNMERLTEGYDAVMKQNALLRELIEDGYRFHSQEVEKKLDDFRSLENERKLREMRPKKDAATQIACAVCAIRDEIFNPVQDIQPHQLFARVDHQQLNEDDDTVPTIHEALAAALGNAVLTARPRKNADGTLRQVVRSPSPPAPFSTQHESANQVKRVHSASEAAGGRSSSPPFRSSYEKDNPSAAAAAAGQQRKVRPMSSTDVRTSSNLNNPVPSNGAMRPQSAAVVQTSAGVAAATTAAAGAPHYSHSMSNLHATPPTSAGGSKFSKMKNIPLGSTRKLPKEKAAMLSAGVQEVRMLSNTAAYLQNQIIERRMSLQSDATRRCYSSSTIPTKNPDLLLFEDEI